MQLSVAIVETIHQSTKHRNNSYQHLLSLKNSFFSRHSLGHQRIQTTGALGPGTACIVKKFRPHLSLTFAVAFRSVQ